MFNIFSDKKEKFVSPQALVNFGLILFAFFSPFSIAGAQTGLCLALLGWAWRVFSNKSLNWQRSFFDLPVLIYLGAYFISILFSQNQLKSLMSLREEWLLLIPFLLINNLQDENFIRKLVNLMLFISGLVALYAIWQHYSGRDLLGHILYGPFPPHYKFRSTGFFGLPLTYSFYAMLISIIGFSLGSSERKTSLKIFYFTISALCVTGNLFTYTRSTLYAQIFILILFFVFSKSQHKVKEILGVVVYFIAINLIDPGIISRSIETAKAGSLEQADIRSVIWSTSFNIFKDHPLFGIGFGNFKEFYQSYLKIPSAVFNHAHNDFLNLAVNAGIIGFLAFVFLWVVLLRNLWRRFKKKEKGYSKALILGGVLTIFAFLLASQFQCYYTDAEDNMILFFVLGLSEVIYRIGSKELKKETLECKASRS